MKPTVVASLCLALAACATEGEMPDPMESPDAGMPEVDAPLPPPPEPKPEFTAGSQLGGQLAIDETGIRPSFYIEGVEYLSVIPVGLTNTATMESCTVQLFPKFVAFGSASTSTRQFKTVVLDFAQATILQDGCGWDDAHILAGLAARFGNYIVGFAQARFAEDRPYVDVYLNAANGLGNQTANITRAGGGTAFAMDAAGNVSETIVEPTPGQPLVRAVYDF
ncbi:MAG: hypothetical protein ACKV2T_03955 [Kofleriaceae bacterium]